MVKKKKNNSFLILNFIKFILRKNGINQKKYNIDMVVYDIRLITD